MNKLELARMVMVSVNQLPELSESEIALVNSAILGLSQKGFNECMLNEEHSSLGDLQTTINVVNRVVTRYELGFSRIYSMCGDNLRKANKLRKELVANIGICSDVLDTLYALYEEECKAYNEER